MRKHTKIITEEIHEHGVISFELPLYERLMNIAAAENIRQEHLNMIVEKSIKISEEEDGDALRLDHLSDITLGTPASGPSVV